eukprot:c20364_g1_i3 orf=325-960(-)
MPENEDCITYTLALHDDGGSKCDGGVDGGKASHNASSFLFATRVYTKVSTSAAILSPPLPSTPTSPSPCLLASASLPQAFKRVGSLHRNNSSLSTAQAMATQTQGTGNIVVYVTVPNKDAGKDLANSIVSARLAACVNQVPGVESTYWWEGKVETDSEVLLIIKTKESLLQALTQHVKENHKYEVPEVIALPIIGGNPAYLKWLEDSTKAE